MAATVGELLRDAAARLTESGSETPRLDSEVLLGHVLRVDRATLLAGPEAGVGAERGASSSKRSWSGARPASPSSYIRGIKEFYGIAFTIDPTGAHPAGRRRRRSSIWPSRASGILLTAAPRRADAPLRIWDVGTGSGAIAVAVAIESRRRGYARDLRLRATDVSAEALSLAIENAVVHGVADAIDFAQADLTGGSDR